MGSTSGSGPWAIGLTAFAVGWGAAVARADDPSISAFRDWQYYNNTGWRALNRGNLARASQAFQQAIEILRPYQASQARTLARSYADYAELLCRQKRYDAAEPLARWALTVREKSPGMPAESIRQSLDLLSRIQLARRRTAEAETLLTRLLALQETSLGTGHPDMVATVESLALLKAEQGKIVEAERMYRRALTIRDENSARNLKDAEALEQQATLLQMLQPMRNQAEHLIVRARAVRETTAESAGMATTSERFAAVLRRSGKLDEAEDLEARARAIRDDLETRAARAKTGR